MPGELTTIRELARSASDGTSSSTLIDTLLTRARACNERDRFYIRILDARAGGRARAVDAWTDDSAARAPLPLLGVPAVVKDNIEMLGEATSCGSRVFARPEASRDASIVRRLEEQGAVIIAKTNLDEAALGASGRNAHYGRCLNPRNAGLLSGGSSSGSAAAVAAGHALIGIGTDTLGSVRIPAALCGLVGFKPTHGRIPADGVFPLYEDFDTVGVLCRSLEDAALTAAALMGAAVPQPVVEDERLRLWVLPDAALADTGDVRAGDYRRIVDILRDSPGVLLRECPEFRYAQVARAALWEVASTFGRKANFNPDAAAMLGEELRSVLGHAHAMSDQALRSGRILLDASATFMRNLLSEADGLLTPTLPVVGIDALKALPKSIAAYVAPANVAGLPAVSWPQYVDSRCVVSLQIIGRAGRDFQLLNHAARVQALIGRGAY